VFLKALNNIDTYHFRGSSFQSWLFRIAHNLIIDHYRTSKSDFLPLTDLITCSNKDDPVYQTEQVMEAKVLKNAIEKLPPAQKEVISLRFGAQMSIAETAKVTGKTEGSVKKLQFEALAKLRNIVGHV